MKKPEIVHRKKYADGRETPLETHMRLGVNRTCDGCHQRPGEILILVWILLSDLTRGAAQLLAVKHGGIVPQVELKAGPAALVSKTAACSSCRKALLTATAKGPSYAFVDIVECPIQRITVQSAGVG